MRRFAAVASAARIRGPAHLSQKLQLFPTLCFPRVVLMPNHESGHRWYAYRVQLDCISSAEFCQTLIATPLWNLSFTEGVAGFPLPLTSSAPAAPIEVG